MFNIRAVIENLSDEYGGPAVSLPSLLKALDDYHGVDSSILSGARMSELTSNQTVKELGVKLSSFTISGPDKVKFSSELEGKLANSINKDSVLYLNNLWNYVSYCASKYARKNNVPLVTAVRGALYPWSLSQRKYLKKVAWSLFQKKALEESELIHVTCEEEANALDDLGVGQKCFICPHGVKLQPKSTRPKSYYKNLSGLGKDYKCVLFLSRLHSKKGLDDLLNVWQKIYVSFPDWKLVIAGPDYGNYKVKINELNKSTNNSIVLKDMVLGEAKEYLFRASDLFVLPSYTENFGVVIAEALSYRVPVITTTNTPWLALNDNSAGSCIELNYETLFQTMKEYMEMDDSILLKYGENGFKLVESKYSWSKSAEIFYNTINKSL